MANNAKTALPVTLSARCSQYVESVIQEKRCIETSMKKPKTATSGTCRMFQSGNFFLNNSTCPKIKKRFTTKVVSPKL